MQLVFAVSLLRKWGGASRFSNISTIWILRGLRLMLISQIDCHRGILRHENFIPPPNHKKCQKLSFKQDETTTTVWIHVMLSTSLFWSKTKWHKNRTKVTLMCSIGVHARSQSRSSRHKKNEDVKSQGEKFDGKPSPLIEEQPFSMFARGHQQPRLMSVWVFTKASLCMFLPTLGYAAVQKKGKWEVYSLGSNY